MPLLSGSVLPLAVAIRSSLVTAGSGVIVTAGAVGSALTVKFTESTAESPSVSVTVTVRVCSPEVSVVFINEATPVLSALWVLISPSRLDSQDRASS